MFDSSGWVPGPGGWEPEERDIPTPLWVKVFAVSCTAFAVVMIAGMFYAVVSGSEPDVGAMIERWQLRHSLDK